MPESVLTIYRIEDRTMLQKGHEEVSQYVADNYGKDAVCHDVVHADMTEIDLTRRVINALANPSSDKLSGDLKHQARSGANYVFVGPADGEPVFGRKLTQLLAA